MPTRRVRSKTSAWAPLVVILTGVALAIAAPAQVRASVQSQLAEIEDTDFAEGYAPLVRAVLPAVVAVRVEQARPARAPTLPDGGDPNLREFFERFFGSPGQPQDEAPGENAPPGPEVGLGSGFIISADGLVVTNAHVVGDARRVEVRLTDDRVLDAVVRGVDPLTDLALLEIEVDEDLPYVMLGDSDTVEVGNRVVAIGNPFGLGGTVTAGIVSAMGRRLGSGPYDDFLQIDASINRGNSGGPTFDLDGNVVGVNTAIFSPSGGSVGIGFAIASNLARDVVAELRETGEVRRGWLGVGIQELDAPLAEQFGLDPATRGTIVTQVEPASPAAEAGLETGDVIIALNGDPVPGPDALSRLVASLDPGEETEFTFFRDGVEQRASVILGQRPQPQRQLGQVEPEANQAAPPLGLALAPLDEAERQQRGIAAGQGVVVAGVEPASPAAEAGVERGDVILQVGQSDVATPDDVAQQVRTTRDAGADSVLVLIHRDGAQRFATLPLDLS